MSWLHGEYSWPAWRCSGYVGTKAGHARMSVIMDKLRKDVTPNAWHTVVDTRQHALRSIYYIFSRHREIVHVEGFTSLAAAACAGADHESPAHCIPQC